MVYGLILSGIKVLDCHKKQKKLTKGFKYANMNIRAVITMVHVG